MTNFFLGRPYTVTIAVLAIFGLVYISSALLPFGFRNIGHTINGDLEVADKTRDTIINSRIKFNQQIPNENAVINQYNYIGALKKQYLDVAMNYEVHYYTFVTMLVLASACLTMVIAVISQGGWQTQSPILKAAFYGLFFVSSVSGIFVSVFSYSQNSGDNVNKYFYLTNLQTNIYNVITVNSDFKSNGTISLKRDSDLLKVFVENNENLKSNLNLYLNIKAESIPSTPDVTKVLAPAKAGETGQQK